MALSGRTTSIINRFPKFYLPEDPKSDFYQFIEVFAAIVGQAEADIERVLRSRFVSTAENLESQGVNSFQKGDLDRIFTLYLERLGGTSQLNQIRQMIQPSDINQLDTFLESFDFTQDLTESSVVLKDPIEQSRQAILEFIWQQRSPEFESLVQRYHLNNTAFPETLQISVQQATALIQSTDLQQLPLSRLLKAQLSAPEPLEAIPQLQQELVVVWLLKLLTATDSLMVYLRDQLSAIAQQLLNVYDGTIPAPLELTRAIAAVLNQIVLPDRSFSQQVQARLKLLSIQINLLQKLQRLARSTPVSKAFTGVGQFLYGWLSSDAQRLMHDLPTELNLLKLKLSAELTPLLPSLRIYGQIDRYIQELDESSSHLTEYALTLLVDVWQELLTANLKRNLGTDPPFTIAPLPKNKDLLAQNPTKGTALYRLNRLLLEATYPIELPHSNIPSKAECAEIICQFLNEKILQTLNLTDIQPNFIFYADNAEHFGQLPIGTEAIALIQKVTSKVDISTKILIRLNRLLLEALYPNELEKSDTLYRERMMRLIEVIKNGASTRDGIVDIVTANLGMGRDRRTGVKPWEVLVSSFSIDEVQALHQLNASPRLRSLFQSQAKIRLALGTIVTVEEPEREWLITDAIEGRVFRIYRQENQLEIHEQLIRVIEYLPTVLSTTQTIQPLPVTSSLTLKNPNPNVGVIVPTLTFKIHHGDSNLYDTLDLNLPDDADLINVVLKYQKFLPESLYDAFGVSKTNGTSRIIPLADPSAIDQVWKVEVINDNQLTQQYTIQSKDQKPGSRKPVVQRRHRLPSLSHLSLQNSESGTVLQYLPPLYADQSLEWSPEGTVMVNGRIVTDRTLVHGSSPSLRSESSEWQMKAQITFEEAALDITLLDFCCFDAEKTMDLTPEQADQYFIDVETTFYQTTPGQFVVRIPWDIPGYSDRFDETLDHPRHQIHSLIENVRATGVASAIVYEKTFPIEIQETQPIFRFKQQYPFENHSIGDKITLDKISEQSLKGDQYITIHDITEQFYTGAMFDYTYFDSLNGFG